MDLHYFSELIDNRINNFKELEKKESKLTNLHEAIKKHIKREQLIHIGFCGGFSAAAVQEIVRQFYNKDPNFTLAILGATTIGEYLVGANLEKPLIKKLITTFAADAYPRTTTVPIFNYQLKKGMEMEYWSILSYTSSLLAGALRLPFLPTNSLLGSSMEKENTMSFKRIKDPFSQNEDIGIIKALIPDVSIYHAWASDSYGNSVFAPPYGSDIYGAYACRGPVIVTTEKIVDTDYIKKNRGFVRLPGHIVSCVIEAPYGVHPSMYYGLQGGYMEDMEFLIDFHNQNRTPEGLNKWIKEWILDTKNFQGYSNKVGIENFKRLSDKLRPNSWIEDLKLNLDNIKMIDEQAPNSLEFMIVTAAEIIAEKIKEKNFDVVLAGQGHSNLAAWLARYICLRDNYFTNLVAEVGFYGYLPRPGNPFIFNVLNIPTCNMTANILNILGMTLGCSKSCAILGAAQIDKSGNINSSKVGSHHLVGSGGANDCGSPNRVEEIIVVCIHGKDRMLEKVPYITVPGNVVSTVITTDAVLKKDEKNNELILTEVFNFKNLPKSKLLEDIKSKTGWDLKISDNLIERSIVLDKQNIAILRLFDPHRFFIRSEY